MRPPVFSLAILGLSLCASAQTRSAANSTQPAIGYVKSLLASSFDKRLPRIPLETFLSYETGSIRGKWLLVKCPKGTIVVGEHTDQQFLTCVEADYDVNTPAQLDLPAQAPSDAALATVLVSIMGSAKGQFSSETILNLVVTDVTGAVRQVHNLADLPMELHRPHPRMPKALPKDLPAPVG